MPVLLHHCGLRITGDGAEESVSGAVLAKLPDHDTGEPTAVSKLDFAADGDDVVEDDAGDFIELRGGVMEACDVGKCVRLAVLQAAPIEGKSEAQPLTRCASEDLTVDVVHGGGVAECCPSLS